MIASGNFPSCMTKLRSTVGICTCLKCFWINASTFYQGFSFSFNIPILASFAFNNDWILKGNRNPYGLWVFGGNYKCTLWRSKPRHSELDTCRYNNDHPRDISFLSAIGNILICPHLRHDFSYSLLYWNS